MVRLPCAWTVHDTPRRNSRSLQRCRPGRAPHPSVQRDPQATSTRPARSTFPCSCRRRCASRTSSPPTEPAATHSNPSKPHLRRHDFRSHSETKPIKDPASVCGLAHCTVSSLSRRSACSLCFLLSRAAKLMKPFSVLIKESSGNIFRDLGFPHPEREHLKARLTLQIYRLIKDRGLTQTQAGQILGIRQPHGFSHLKSPSSRPAGSMARCLWFSDNLAAADYGPAQW